MPKIDQLVIKHWSPATLACYWSCTVVMMEFWQERTTYLALKLIFMCILESTKSIHEWQLERKGEWETFQQNAIGLWHKETEKAWNPFSHGVLPVEAVDPSWPSFSFPPPTSLHNSFKTFSTLISMTWIFLVKVYVPFSSSLSNSIPPSPSLYNNAKPENQARRPLYIISLLIHFVQWNDGRSVWLVQSPPSGQQRDKHYAQIIK